MGLVSADNLVQKGPPGKDLVSVESCGILHCEAFYSADVSTCSDSWSAIVFAIAEVTP